MNLESIKVGSLQTAIKTIFAQGVKNKKYKRLPYNIWTQIMALSPDYVGTIKIEDAISQDQFFNITFWVPLVLDDGLTFTNAPDSFGSFLLDYINQIREERKKEMDMTTNTTNNTTSSYTAYATTATPINGFASGGYYTIDNSTWTNIQYDDICRKSECPYNKKEEKKEKNTMIKNFDFGPCTNDRVALSPYGIAVQNLNGVWVSYNKDNKQIIDVDIFHSVDGRKFLYKMPVAISQIAVGDVILHNGNPVFVESVDNGIQAVDISVNEKKIIMPTTNMFGFDFITKIVSMMDVCATAPTPDQPFGNMLPFLMMDSSKDNDNMLLALMMMNGNGGMDMSNPMMMYFMFKDNKDMLPFILMMNQKK